MKRAVSTLAAISISTFLALPAWADVPPPDACNGSEGSACNTAGEQFDKPGVCNTQTCTRTTPDGNTMEYECQRCVLDTAGAGSGGTGGSSSSTSGSGGTSTDSGKAKGGGCALFGGGRSSSSGSVFLMGLLGLALMRSRISRKPRA